MDANEIQHGGSHYKGSEYQHWDWVTDIRLPYLLATATKYAFRWRKKGGLLDLQKLDHYLQKAEERGVQGSTANNRHDMFWKLVRDNDLDLHDASIIFAAMEGQYARARELTQVLLEQTRTNDRIDEITAAQLHP